MRKSSSTSWICWAMSKPDGLVRLDKYLADCLGKTRTQVKDLIRGGRVTSGGEVLTRPELKVSPGLAIEVDGKPTGQAEPFVYYLLNKPQGVVSATEDPRQRTVLGLLPPHPRRSLFPVGRLDKDTEGLLLITDDGALAHALLSPKYHVDKVYLILARGIATQEHADRIAQGIGIGQGEQALPAKLEILETDIKDHTSRLRMTIHEGKFHQVKRMIAACGMEVLALKRVRMGPLSLPEELSPGQYRLLTQEEKKSLENCVRKGVSGDGSP